MNNSPNSPHSPKTPLSELYWSGKAYEYPISVENWEYSTIFGKWGRIVTFDSGWRGFTFPKIPRPNKQGEYPGIFEFSLHNIICRRICGVNDYHPFNPEEILHSPHEKFNWLGVFMEVVGKGTRKTTKEKLERAFMDCFSKVKTCGLFNRLIFSVKDNYVSSNNSCGYTAGQDYRSEMALIRKIITKYY